MDDLVFASAQELAEAIRNRHVSALEVLDAHLAQIDRHNPRLNVIVTLDIERAQARAREADAALARGEIWGPLHGVPMTIKDGFATAGLRTTSGFPPWADFVPEADAQVVARLRASGVILLGKTNLPTFSMDVQTHNPIFGRTNNPWDLSRTPGGSTGGAAAVAAGLTSLELGSDLAGSVRIPAHCCGIYALKPSDYRLPGGGYHPNPEPEWPDTGGPAQLGVFGPLARSVDDLAIAFQIMAGPARGQWAIPPIPIGLMPELKLNQLHLAWMDDFGGVPIGTDIRVALEKLVQDLDQQGCRIEHQAPKIFDFTSAWKLWGEMTAVMMGFDPDTAANSGFRPDSESLMMRGGAKGTQLTLREHMANLRERSVLINALEAFFEQWDALICPVMSVPAFPHCDTGAPIQVDEQWVEYWIASISYTCPFNLTGHPVVVLPVAQTPNGLPVGVQVVGRRWGEMPLLAIAKCITEVVGAFQRPPGY